MLLPSSNAREVNWGGGMHKKLVNLAAPSTRNHYAPWSTSPSSDLLSNCNANCLCFGAYQEGVNLQRPRHFGGKIERAADKADTMLCIFSWHTGLNKKKSVGRSRARLTRHCQQPFPFPCSLSIASLSCSHFSLRVACVCPLLGSMSLPLWSSAGESTSPFCLQ